MRENQFKRIINEKPYLLDGLFVRSRYEAQQMALSSTLTIEQVLQPIRQDPGISETTWARVDSAIRTLHQSEGVQTTHKKRPRDWRSNRKTRTRVFAAVAAVILVVAFFTLIPSGKTLAKNAFDYIMHVFENHIQIEPAGQGPRHPSLYINYEAAPGETVNEDGDLIVHYDDLKSFASEYGVSPVGLLSDAFVCSDITLTKYATSGASLTSSYTSDTGVIIVKQEWLVDNGMSFHSNSDAWESVTILDDVELLYAIDKLDGVFDGIAMLPDSVLWVSAQKSVDILKQLPNLRYES